MDGLNGQAEVLRTDVQFHQFEDEVIAPNHGTLMAHCGTSKISREELLGLPLPEGTNSFQPIAHSVLVDTIEESLSYRRISIKRSEFAVSPDGMKMFGLLEVNADYEGIRFAIGLRNANDKSMRVGIVAGYRVFCCDNMAFNGDFQPMLAKHSKNLDIIESVSMGIDRIQRSWNPLKAAIDHKRNTELDTDEAKLLIYQAFMEKKFPVTLMKQVHKGYFEPEYEEFKPNTLWSIENAFTGAFKTLNPVSHFQQTARLGKFLSSLN